MLAQIVGLLCLVILGFNTVGNSGSSKADYSNYTY